mgnify:CR=1 FL=1
MDDELSLPDWNSGLWHEQAAIDCSPVKQPLAQVKAGLAPAAASNQTQQPPNTALPLLPRRQVTLKDGNTQRVTALGRPGAAPGAAAAGGRRSGLWATCCRCRILFSTPPLLPTAAMPAFVAAPPPARPHQLGAPGAGTASAGAASCPDPSCPPAAVVFHWPAQLSSTQNAINPVAPRCRAPLCRRWRGRCATRQRVTPHPHAQPHRPEGACGAPQPAGPHPGRQTA